MSLSSILETFNDQKKVEAPSIPKIVEKDKDGVSLKAVLQKHRAKLLREKPLSRQGKSFSPSSLTWSYCRRLKVAQLAGKAEIFYDKVAPAQQTIFDMGNLMHDLVQGYFWEIGILKGTFKCIKCNKNYDELLAPKECPKGHPSKYMLYREVKMKNEQYSLNGRCDGILAIENEEHLVDIKSISNRGTSSGPNEFCFEDLDEKGPKHDHIVQVTLYMFMSGIHKGHLLYISKNKGRIKTFSIPYNENILRPYFNEIIYLKELAEKLKAGELTAAEMPIPCGRDTCSCEQILSKD